MKCSLRIALALSFSLASCSKHSNTLLTVKAADTFSGHFHLTPCISGVHEPVLLDETAEGYTSACPTGDLEIAVIKPSKTIRIAPENVHVRRNSHGTPVAITSEIP
jgi:hypothetical protein